MAAHSPRRLEHQSRDEEESEASYARAISDDESLYGASATPFDQDGEEEVEEGTVVDPKNCERYIWRDLRTKIEREIWQPGDGDGDRKTDYFDRVDPPTNIKDRWKFYQSSFGPIKPGHNEPPKYVFLDDRACYEVTSSDVPRASLGKYWPHDFGQSGKLRDRRPHRGRGSVGDPDAEGNDRFDYVQVGTKAARYYFTGEKDYWPIIYRSEELTAQIDKKLVKKPSVARPDQRADNQLTPRASLKPDRNQSKSSARKRKKAEHKIPEWLLDKPKPFDNASQIHATASGSRERPVLPDLSLARMDGADGMGAVYKPSPKRQRVGEGTIMEDNSSGPTHMSLSHRQTVGHQSVPSGLHNPLAPIVNGQHQESTCPYTESRAYAAQLERDLAKAQDTISAQKERIAELELADEEKQGLVDNLRRELQNLTWSIE